MKPKPHDHRSSRRHFLKRAAFVSTGLIFVPKHLAAQSVLTADGLASFIPRAATGGGGGGGDITSNLVTWWKFDDGSGSTAADSSGNSNTGTLNNSPSWVSGQIGSNALSFVSTISQSVTGSASALGGATKATIAAWINRASTANKVAFGVGSVSQFDRFNAIWFTDGKIYFDYGNGSSTQFASVSLTGSGWHHVVLIFDGTLSGNARIACYVDGSVQTLSYNATPPASLSSSGNLGNFMIGREIANGYSDGTIDDFRAYTRALVSADVSTLYSYR